ncbi:MAG: cell division protein FtsL [Porticoccaceae bacterium]|nr:cell division protein FtsL [Porticoccaceae bacterium]MDC0640544.1 cell division protein FtsL [Porticoccaceae bacterium]MDG1485737.1 cell division protein FtsL [Porticoccaceae bacterium]
MSAAGTLRLALLWILVLVSAVSVALVSHLCRQQYAELMALQREASQMDEDYGKYLLEQSAWGSLQRIETKAVQELKMRSPRPDEILMVKPD